MLYSGASAADLQMALNDLPTLSPNLVAVSERLHTDRVSKIYTVTFSAYLGNVELIQETLGLVTLTASEIQAGSPSGAKFQINILNQTSNLFDLANSNSVNIKLLI